MSARASMTSLRARCGNAIRRRIPTPIRQMAGRAFSPSARSTAAPGAWPQAVPVEERRVDPWLFAAIVSLVGLGVVMVYSASAVYAQRKFGSGDHFLRRVLLWVAMGVGAMTFAMLTDYGQWRRRVYPLLLCAIGMLIAVLLVGVRINGARRWFHLAGVSFQPAELAKLAVVLYLAHSLARKSGKVATFTIGFLPHVIIAGLMAVLLLAQPDLGTAVILGLATLILLFVAGARVGYIFMALLASAPVVYWAIVSTPWRLMRFKAFLDPWKHRLGYGYQLAASLIAVGSGGPTGVGLGDSQQKLFYLPEAHTDYILAIVGEELGFIGVASVAAIFVVFVWRGVRSALRARDAFGCYVAFGLTALIALQAMVNFGVVFGALPTKGLPLPFVSFGGSTLVVDLFAAGILLNVSRGAPEPGPNVQSPPWRRWTSWTQLLSGRGANRRRGPRGRVSSGGGSAGAGLPATLPRETLAGTTPLGA